MDLGFVGGFVRVREGGEGFGGFGWFWGGSLGVNGVKGLGFGIWVRTGWENKAWDIEFGGVGE